MLDYTLSSGLNLVDNSSGSGTTGLIGLTGQVVGGDVELFATNATIGDLDPTFLYGITDSLAATALPSAETFTKLATAAPDTNIRGVAFAPETVCFASGTRIRILRGEAVDVAVEELAVGDLAVTSSGAARAIKWIGHRILDPRRHPRPSDAMPVRIAAHALGENRPARDLWVSPGHAICLDMVGEVLIPASSLINGSSIRQIDVETVAYWHVELDSHDILVAENLAAESYLDVGNRQFFNESGVVDLHATPDAGSRINAKFCRPTCHRGPLVDVVRSQLRLRAEALGWRRVEPAFVGALRTRDLATGRHSSAVALYARELAQEVGVDPTDQDTVRVAALLHDIAKVTWPDRVLHAEAHGEALAAQDQALIDNAPQLCAELIGQLDGYGAVADTVLYHRERMDGSGYPAGLIGKEIPLTSRILAVCCVYDAMRSRNDYRAPMSEPEATQELRVAGERGQLDPDLVETFVALIRSKGAELEEHVLTAEELDIGRHTATREATHSHAVETSRPDSR